VSDTVARALLGEWKLRRAGGDLPEVALRVGEVAAVTVSDTGRSAAKPGHKPLVGAVVTGSRVCLTPWLVPYSANGSCVAPVATSQR
jgi:hypothetical protein